MSLRKVVFKQINAKYMSGELGRVKLVFVSNYFNATSMCSFVHKSFDEWLSTNQACETIEALCQMLHSPRSALIMQRGSGELAGTYIRVELLSSLAMWCGDDIFLDAQDIGYTYRINAKTNKLDKLIADVIKSQQQKSEQMELLHEMLRERDVKLTQNYQSLCTNYARLESLRQRIGNHHYLE